MKKVLVAYNQGEPEVNKAVRKYGGNWLKHIKREGVTYIDKIDNLQKNREHIPGYFGEKRK